MTPVAKYWVCKIAPPVLYEAMECLGGNGYVEELPLARLYREVPVNAIWEGSGNVMALDVLRVLQREPAAAEIVLDDIAAACRGDAKLAAGWDRGAGHPAGAAPARHAGAQPRRRASGAGGRCHPEGTCTGSGFRSVHRNARGGA